MVSVYVGRPTRTMTSSKTRIIFQVLVCMLQELWFRAHRTLAGHESKFQFLPLVPAGTGQV